MALEQDSKAIVGRWFEGFWGNPWNPKIVDELAAPDMLLQYSLHAPRRGRPLGGWRNTHRTRPQRLSRRLSFERLPAERCGSRVRQCSGREWQNCRSDRRYRTSTAWHLESCLAGQEDPAGNRLGFPKRLVGVHLFPHLRDEPMVIHGECCSGDSRL
jgi:hypothetical protein